MIICSKGNTRYDAKSKTLGTIEIYIYFCMAYQPTVCILKLIE